MYERSCIEKYKRSVGMSKNGIISNGTTTRGFGIETRKTGNRNKVIQSWGSFDYKIAVNDGVFSYIDRKFKKWSDLGVKDRELKAQNAISVLRKNDNYEAVEYIEENYSNYLGQVNLLLECEGLNEDKWQVLKDICIDIKEKWAIHKNYLKYKDLLQGKGLTLFTKIADSVSKVLSIIENFDGSGISALINKVLGLVKMIATYAGEAMALTDPDLRLELTPLLSKDLDFGSAFDMFNETRKLALQVEGVVEGIKELD
ncbi:hypothetical protein [Vibrio nomapromontoriensis]|uniref:hypothetical protein n=1 Tax=Vibrio nomapromontoriensis TaxID=2910246 RepID=UPI003D0E5A80